MCTDVVYMWALCTRAGRRCVYKRAGRVVCDGVVYRRCVQQQVGRCIMAACVCEVASTCRRCVQRMWAMCRESDSLVND